MNSIRSTEMSTPTESPVVDFVALQNLTNPQETFRVVVDPLSETLLIPEST